MKQMLCDSTDRPADDPISQEHRALLAEINADLPAGVDWTAGAQRYVMAEIAKYGREPYIRYLLAKPFALVHPGEGGRASRLEDAHYLYNFTNAFALLDLPGGSAVLDVACGSGWISHFFALMGYAAHGFDLCVDMIDITRRRLHQDPGLAEFHPLLEGRFFQLDIERQKLPSTLAGTFGAIVLESCLHHFLDPITALSHLVEGLSPEGLVLVIEGEARTGPLNPAYVAVMREFCTLERPYTRDQLTRVLRLAGLPHHRFLGRLNGWFTADDPALAYLTERLRADADALNLAICARTPEALRRVVPHYGG
jgi:SAM-dependent methyltransferase